MFQIMFLSKKINFLKIISLFSLSFFLSPAHSQETLFEAGNLTITSMGVHGDTPYFRVAEPLGAQCAYAVIYIPTDKKLMYAQVLSAKVGGIKLSRVTFKLTNGPDSECHAIVVEMA